MAKRKKLTKKSLLIASLALIVVFALSLVVMAVVPYSATTYRNPDSLVTEYRFTSDGYTTRLETAGSDTKTKPVEFKVEKNEDGENVVKYGNGVFTLGKINAYKLVVGDTVYTNTFTTTLMIISIVGVSLGGVGLVLYFVLGNKKTSKKKK